MKVITEERLAEILNYPIDGEVSGEALLHHLINNECQELDTLTVTRLRPMSDLMSINDYSYFVLAFKDSKQEFVRVRQSSNDEVFCADTGKFHNINQFSGFIPMPRYEPEKV